jgi:hypothetical protein
MADFYIITKLAVSGDVKHHVMDANKFTSAQAKTKHKELHAESGTAVSIYREVSETVSNQVILNR